MSDWESKLRERYEQVEVPAPLRTMDAIDPRVTDISQDFFMRIAASFQLSRLALSSLVRVNVRTLVPPFASSAVHYAETIRASDDFLEELSIEGK